MSNDEVEILQRYGLEDCQEDAQIVQLIPLLRDVEKNQKFINELNEEMEELDEAMADVIKKSGMLALGSLALIGGPIGLIVAGTTALDAYSEYEEAKRERKKKMSAARKSRKEVASAKLDNVVYLNTKLEELANRFKVWCDKSAQSKGEIGTELSRKQEELFKRKLISYAGFVYSAALTEYYINKFQVWLKGRDNKKQPPLPSDVMLYCLNQYVDSDTVYNLVAKKTEV